MAAEGKDNKTKKSEDKERAKRRREEEGGDWPKRVSGFASAAGFAFPAMWLLQPFLAGYVLVLQYTKYFSDNYLVKCH